MNMEDKNLIQLFGNCTGLEQSILDDITKDINIMFNDCFYYLRLIGEIVLNSQWFEICLRKYLKMNGVDEGNIWHTGGLINTLGKNELFTAREVEILRKIIENRNWVVHKLYVEELNGTYLVDDRNSKLAVTKHMLYEAIDFVNDKIEKMCGRSGVSNIINNTNNL